MTALDRFRAYLALARPEHWLRNVLMIPGSALAYTYYPERLDWGSLGKVLGAFGVACLLASASYVLNGLRDAATDAQHPLKCRRPLASGVLPARHAWIEWLVLTGLGLGGALFFGRMFFATALAWFAMALVYNVPPATALAWFAMALVYNVPPLRTKDLAYVDVLSESVNNPLRLLAGWFAVSQTEIPPVSLLLAYWAAGAFFMAGKRLAELRMFGDRQRAAAYRRSFGRYSENALLVSMFFHAVVAALFLGVFVIRYHLELILGLPLVAGFFAYYLHLTLQPNSMAQSPERLYRQRGLIWYLVLCTAVFIGLLLVRIPLLYEWFNVAPSGVPPLWEVRHPPLVKFLGPVDYHVDAPRGSRG
jgi:decaprenyl-phosphate phosphoribosyltransferase